MKSFPHRLLAAAAVLALLVGVGAVQANRQFGWLEGEGPDGRSLNLRGPVRVERLGAFLRVTLEAREGRAELVFPNVPAAAESVLGTMHLVTAEGRATDATVRLDVEESGAYLGARLFAESSAFRLNGGLRVRLEPAGAVSALAAVAQ